LRKTFLLVFACALDVIQLGKMFWFLSFCSDLFLSSFGFSALTLVFQLFTCKLYLQIARLRMRNFTLNRFPIKILLIDSLLIPIVESTCLNIL